MVRLLPSEVLAKKENWTKNYQARNIHGDVVSIYSKDAISYCLVGALYICDFYDTVGKLLSLVKARGFWTISGFNDDPDTTHEDVLSVLREAGL